MLTFGFFLRCKGDNVYRNHKNYFSVLGRDLQKGQFQKGWFTDFQEREKVRGFYFTMISLEFQWSIACFPWACSVCLLLGCLMYIHLQWYCEAVIISSQQEPKSRLRRDPQEVSGRTVWLQGHRAVSMAIWRDPHCAKPLGSHHTWRCWLEPVYLGTQDARSLTLCGLKPGKTLLVGVRDHRILVSFYEGAQSWYHTRWLRQGVVIEYLFVSVT